MEWLESCWVEEMHLMVEFVFRAGSGVGLWVACEQLLGAGSGQMRGWLDVTQALILKVVRVPAPELAVPYCGCLVAHTPL